MVSETSSVVLYDTVLSSILPQSHTYHLQSRQQGRHFPFSFLCTFFPFLPAFLRLLYPPPTVLSRSPRQKLDWPSESRLPLFWSNSSLFPFHSSDAAVKNFYFETLCGVDISLKKSEAAWILSGKWYWHFTYLALFLLSEPTQTHSYDARVQQR